MRRKDVSTAGAVIGAAVIVAVVFGAVAARAADYKYEEAVSKTIELEGARKLVIESLSGDITVTGEADRKSIELKIVKYVRAEDEETARKLAKSMGVVVTRPEEMIKLETRYPKKGKVKTSIFSFFVERGNSMNITLDLKIPAGLEVETASASGNVEISSVLAGVEASSASGDLIIRDIGKDVVAHVASGDIEIGDIGGSVSVSSAAGDILVRDIAGNADISVATGDVEISSVGGSLTLNTYTGDAVVEGVGAVRYEGINGSASFIDVRGAVEASAASGDISFRVTPVELSSYHITASSGNIVLRFLDAMEGGFILKASTTSGEISASLPIKVTKVDRNRIAGIVREGRAKVVLETASGNITVEEPGE
jgi:hypothetical protein